MIPMLESEKTIENNHYPGEEPKELTRAKRLRNQIYFLQQESHKLHYTYFVLMQKKWQIDAKIKLLMDEQENLTRKYFTDNGLTKVSKPKPKSKPKKKATARDLSMEEIEMLAAMLEKEKGE